MQTLLIYVAKAIIYSCIFFGYYCLALRNKRFHYYNRFYLLMSVALSLCLPVLHIELWQWPSDNPQAIQLLNVVQVNRFETVGSSATTSFVWTDAIAVFYVSIFLYLLLSLAFSVIAIFRFKRNYSVEKISGINFINTDLAQAPFSFFNNLFWKNTLDMNNDSGRQIFKHELTYIREKHSWDKLFLRIVAAAFWFNPVYWLMQKELALIHEFIADEKAIEDMNAEAFALMILNSHYTKNIFSPAQSFHYSPIKRRLFMLTKSPRNSYSYARRIMILPLLAATVLFFAFTLKNDKAKGDFLHTNAPFVLVVDAGHGGTDAGAMSLNGLSEKDINLTIAKKIEALAPEYGITVKLTRTEDVAVSVDDRMNFVTKQKPDASISIHVNSSPGQTNNSEVDVFITGDEKANSYLQSRLLGSSVLQSVTKNFLVNDTLQQRRNHSIYVLDKNPYPAVLIECGYMNNAASLKQLTNDATVEQMARDILQGITTYANTNKSVSQSNLATSELASQSNLSPDTTGKTIPLYLVDGKETLVEAVQKIDVNTIESINVLKGDEAAIKKYGQKASNGVVLITLKTSLTPQQNADAKSGTKISTSVKTATDSMLVILDGKMIDSKEIYTINTNDLESVSVIEDEDAIKKYGEKGKNGVVVMTTKAQIKTVQKSYQTPVVLHIDDENHYDTTKTPFYMIDGKEISKEDVNKISPDAIESINVLKSEEAAKKYGEKGKNGVVEIKLKRDVKPKKDSASVDNSKTTAAAPQ